MTEFSKNLTNLSNHTWGFQRITLRHFSPSEFDRPEMMNPAFLKIIDEWRDRCGFAITITDDARNREDMEAIYGSNESTWPNSPHKRGVAVDCKPHAVDSITADKQRMVMVREALKMWEEGLWPRLGLEIATAHLHVDSDTELRRPHMWIGTSR